MAKAGDDVAMEENRVTSTCARAISIRSDSKSSPVIPEAARSEISSRDIRSARMSTYAGKSERNATNAPAKNKSEPTIIIFAR